VKCHCAASRSSKPYLTRYAKAMAKAGVSDWAVAAETAGDKHVIRAAALAPLADPQG